MPTETLQYPDPVTTVVVPVRDEQDNVGPLLRRVHTVVHDDLRHPVEVLFVDDSETPETGVAIQAAARTLSTPHLRIRHIHRTGTVRQGGLTGAVVDGVREARAPHIVVMDGDLQHPPETLPHIMQQLKGNHLVVASRYRRGGNNDGLDGFVRKFVSRSATALTRLLFPRVLRGITDPMTGFFAFHRDELDLERLKDGSGFKILLEILASHLHLKRAEVPLQFQARVDGKSKSGEGNGAEFLRQVARLRLRTIPAFLNFMFGGGAIAAMGALMLWLMVGNGVNPLVANAVQLVTTLVLNFLYNRMITWRGAGGSLKRQMLSFGVTRVLTQLGSWGAFVGLMAVGAHLDLFSLTWRAQLANAIAIGGAMLVNFMTSKYIVFRSHHRHRRRSRAKLAFAAVAMLGTGGTCMALGAFGWRACFIALIVTYAVFSLTMSTAELRWRIYGRRTPEARASMGFPTPVPVQDAQMFFSFILPVKHGSYAVVSKTVAAVMAQGHPNFELVLSLAEGDHATIAAAHQIAQTYPRIRIITQYYGKSSKPKQLNTAWPQCRGDVIGIVDAETLTMPGLLLAVEAEFRKDPTIGIVQGGVQLMNLGLKPPKEWGKFAKYPRLQRVLRWVFTSKLWMALRGWFCVHNVMEYYNWFSSRMKESADNGVVTLGGNTVFYRKEVIEAIGGIPETLTEDAAAGILASAQGEWRIAVCYDPQLTSREQTPSHIFGAGGLDAQRERWDQGFLQEVFRGNWRKLPLHKRLRALYSLSMPFIQALNGLMLPVSLVSAFVLRAPDFLTLATFLPLIPMMLSVAVQVLSLREFGRDYKKKVSLWNYFSLVVLNLPYQALLALPAIKAVVRHVQGNDDWRSTSHDAQYMEPAESAA